MSPRSLLAGALGALVFGAVPALASGEVVTADFRFLGTFNAPTVTHQGVVVTGISPNPPHHFAADVSVVNLNGLGVVGGSNATALDSSEELRFRFDGFLAEHVWISFSLLLNTDGDADNGEAIVSVRMPGVPGEDFYFASAPIANNLGVYVSGIANGAPIAGFTVQASGDTMVLAEVSYIVGPPSNLVRYTNLGTFTTPELIIDDVRVIARTPANAPGTINVLNLNGLGVVGGFDNTVCDLGESFEVNFLNGVRPDHIWYGGFSGNLDMDSLVGEATITAWNPAGFSLGTVAIHSPLGGIHVNNVFGGSPISRFVVRATDDLFRIGSIAYTCPPGPPPCPTDINGDGQTNSADLTLILGAWGPCP